MSDWFPGGAEWDECSPEEILKKGGEKMTINEEYETLERNLKILKGKRIRMKYNGRILLNKANPSPEEVMLALYSGGKE